MILGLIWSVLLKVFLILGCYFFLQRFFKNRLECAVVAWLVSMVAQNVIFLVLSPFRLLTIWGIVIGYIVVGGGIWIAAWQMSKGKSPDASCEIKEARAGLSKMDVVTLALFGIFFVGLVFRTFFYFDTTDDALIQGMPKLAFIQQHRSLFVHYESLTVNTFSNEWLGELNGFYYMMLVGQDQAAGFGNVELYLFSAFCFYYIVEAFGYKGRFRMQIAFAAATLPVLTGLALTIKTDLIAIALLPLTVAFLLQYYRTQAPTALFASILSVGATAASKISVLPGAGLLLIALIIFYFFRAKKKPVVPVVLGALGSVILCNRYVLNLIQYGNPFQRALNEKMNFSALNLKNSITGALGEFYETGDLLRTVRPWSTSNWALTKGMGYFGGICLLIAIVALVFALYNRKQQDKTEKKATWLVALPVFLGFLFFCTSSIWYDWSFRYVVPYFMVAYFASFAVLQPVEDALCNAGAKNVCTTVMCCFLLLGSMNALSTFRSGQSHPYLITSAAEMSKTEKKLAYASIPRYKDLSAVPGLVNYLETGGSCLIFDTFSYPYYHFFGDNHCVRVDLAYDEEDLIEKAFSAEYNFYVIATTKEDAVGYANARAFFAAHGYSAYETTCGLIFMK